MESNPTSWAKAGLLLPILFAGCGEEIRPPSIVLIVVDTLRADHLSQYGYAPATSPALDAFAAQATRFSSCYAPASWTTPSTASIFTGLLPVVHGAHAQGAALPDQAVTLAELLHEAGWRTVGISYNHNVTATTGFQQGFEHFEGFEGESGEYPDIAKMRRAVGRLRFDSGRPLFLYLQPMNVHGPYRVPEEHAADLLGRSPDPKFRYAEGPAKKIMKSGKLELRAEIEAAYLDSHRDQYDTAIRYSMDQIAAILAKLRQHGVGDESLIVITADHGEELYEHQGFGHGYSLHREVLHVPLWIKLPGQTAGNVIEDWVSLTDLLPTILDTAGRRPPPDLSGRSLLPLIRGDAGVAAERLPPLFQTRWPGRFVGAAVVQWPWKLLHVEESYDGLVDAYRLFHLGNDPHEQHDVAAEHREIVDRLARHLRQRLAPSHQRLPSLSAEDRMNRKALKALGYVD